MPLKLTEQNVTVLLTSKLNCTANDYSAQHMN